MMTASGREIPSSSLQIMQDEKFYSMLLSRESSMANSSCRVYYAVAAGAVPFLWESQPGTPKNPISSASLPPLTPPPSYLIKPKKNPKRHSRSNSLFMAILPRLSTRKAQAFSPPASSSSSSWSLPPSTSSGSLNFRGRSRFSSSRSSFSSTGDEDDNLESPTSTLCFGLGREGSAKMRGCYSMVIVKNALSSIVGGHGSAQGNA